MNTIFLTLKNKFFIQLIVILFVISAIGITTISSVQTSERSFSVIKDIENGLIHTQNMRNAHQDAVRAFETFLETKDESLVTSFNEALLFFDNSPHNKKTFTKLDQIHVHEKNIQSIGLGLISDMLNDNWTSNSDSELSQYKSIVSETDVLMNRVYQEQLMKLNAEVITVESILPKIALLTIYITIGAGVIIIITSALIIFPIVKRMQKLTTFTQSYARGNEWQEVPIGPSDEIGLFTRTFNTMSESIRQKTFDLEQLNVSLDKQVKERTKSLEKQKEIVAEQAERLEVIIETIGEGVVVVNAVNKIIRVNTAAEKILHKTQKELKNQNINTACTMYDDKKRQLLLKDLFKNSKTEAILPSNIVLHHNDSDIAIAGIASRITAHNTTIGTVLILRDVTKRRNLEKIRSEFASVVSHQMRTPLSIIRWQSEALITSAAKALNPKQKKSLGEIYDTNNRLIELVNNFMQVSRLDSDSLSLTFEKTPMKKFVTDIVSELKPFMKEHKVTASLSIPSTTKLSIDTEKMKEVFHNIINNAIKYSPKKSKVTIEQLKRTKKAGMVTFAIKDSGIGIPKENQKHIFEKFYRADNAKAQIPDGNGLGLFIVKTIVELHNGLISFTSNKNGTTFYVILPKE